MKQPRNQHSHGTPLIATFSLQHPAPPPRPTPVSSASCLVTHFKVGPPCWANGLACPALDGLDPAREARVLVSEVSGLVLSGSPITVGVVDDVFSLVQLALDDRYIIATQQWQALCQEVVVRGGAVQWLQQR